MFVESRKGGLGSFYIVGEDDVVVLLEDGHLETRLGEIGATNQSIMSTPDDQCVSFLSLSQNPILLIV